MSGILKNWLDMLQSSVLCSDLLDSTVCMLQSCLQEPFVASCVFDAFSACHIAPYTIRLQRKYRKEVAVQRSTKGLCSVA